MWRILLIVFCLTSAPLYAALPQTKSLKRYTGEEIYRKYNRAVFMIGTCAGQGSGFFISPTIAVSNSHVFDYCNPYTAKIKLTDGTILGIEKILARSDAENDDYILFKVKEYKSKFYIPIECNMKSIAVGMPCYAIGSPYGLENTYSQGQISQLNKLKSEHLIQINVPIDHGSSGGVLLNAYGKAIGITTAGYEGTGANLNFAKSINVLPKAYRAKLCSSAKSSTSTTKKHNNTQNSKTIKVVRKK